MNTEDKAFFEAVAANINKIRLKRKLSYQQLADLVELERSAVIRSLKGRSNLGLTTIQKYALALGVPPVEFFKGIK